MIKIAAKSVKSYKEREKEKLRAQPRAPTFKRQVKEDDSGKETEGTGREVAVREKIMPQMRG